MSTADTKNSNLFISLGFGYHHSNRGIKISIHYKKPLFFFIFFDLGNNYDPQTFDKNV